MKQILISLLLVFTFNLTFANQPEYFNSDMTKEQRAAALNRVFSMLFHRLDVLETSQGRNMTELEEEIERVDEKEISRIGDVEISDEGFYNLRLSGDLDLKGYNILDIGKMAVGSSTAPAYPITLRGSDPQMYISDSNSTNEYYISVSPTQDRLLFYNKETSSDTPIISDYNVNQGMWIDSEGKKVYAIGNDAPAEFDLSTPFKINTISFNAQSVSMSSGNGIFLKPDKSKVYTVSGTTLRQYDLNGDITTSSNQQTYTISEDSFNQDIFLKPDGTKIYILGNGNDIVSEYDFSTNFDITSLSVVNSTGIYDATAQGLFIGDNGSKMYIVGSTDDKIRQYNFSTNWDITTAVYNQEIASQYAIPTGVSFSQDGKTMYEVSSAGEIYESYLTTAWDISTQTNQRNNSILELSQVDKKVYIYDSVSLGNADRYLSDDNTNYEIDFSTHVTFPTIEISSSITNVTGALTDDTVTSEDIKNDIAFDTITLTNVMKGLAGQTSGADGSTITVKGGDGFNSSSAADGGHLLLQGGDGKGTAGKGGDVRISGGAQSGTVKAGDIIFRPGNSTTDTFDGLIYFKDANGNTLLQKLDNLYNARYYSSEIIFDHVRGRDSNSEGYDLLISAGDMRGMTTGDGGDLLLRSGYGVAGVGPDGDGEIYFRIDTSTAAKINRDYDLDMYDNKIVNADWSLVFNKVAVQNGDIAIQSGNIAIKGDE